jgi:hypothetical protein
MLFVFGIYSATQGEGICFWPYNRRLMLQKKMSGQTTQLRGINTQYESIG